MEISALTLKLIFLLIPGAVAAIIYKRLTVRPKEGSDFMFVMNSILFGIFSYVLLQLTVFGCMLFCNTFKEAEHYDYSVLKVFGKLSDATIIPYLEIIGGTFFAVILGLIITLIDDRSYLYKIAKHMKISNKYGEENLYSYFLNSPDIDWIYIRDIKNKLTYKGGAVSFSETPEFKEIELVNVSVFNYPESEFLYEVERLYLCLSKDNLIIEKAISNDVE